MARFLTLLSYCCSCRQSVEISLCYIVAMCPQISRDRSVPKVHAASLATTELCDQGQDVMVG